MAIKDFNDLYKATLDGESSELTSKAESFSKEIYKSSKAKQVINNISQEIYGEEIDPDISYDNFASDTEYGQVLNNSINEGVNQGLSFLKVFGGCSANSFGQVLGIKAESWEDFETSDEISEEDRARAAELSAWNDRDWETPSLIELFRT